jgi:GNAT superfamily N-acetyltransferase
LLGTAAAYRALIRRLRSDGPEARARLRTLDAVEDRERSGAGEHAGAAVADGGRRGGARRAGPADAAELTRLRALMFDAMGRRGDESWRSACEAELRELLAGNVTVAFVVDAPDGSGLACGVVGLLSRRLPSPERAGRGNVVGHVSSMSTDPRWRRQGLARSALEALLAWFAAAGAATATLSATAEAEPLYRSLGFTDPPHPALRLALPAHAGPVPGTHAGPLAGSVASPGAATVVGLGAGPGAGPGAAPATATADEPGPGSGSSGLGRQLSAGHPDA